MDDELARAILRAILKETEGRVGSFIEIEKISSTAAFVGASADAVLDELRSRRWLYRKGNYLAVSKPGVEYAMDRTQALAVLRAIFEVASGKGGRAIPVDQVAPAVSLPRSEFDMILNELYLLGFVTICLVDGSQNQFVCVNASAIILLSDDSASMRTDVGAE
jgi:hypothetical protein